MASPSPSTLSSTTMAMKFMQRGAMRGAASSEKKDDSSRWTVKTVSGVGAEVEALSMADIVGFG
eukprot:CAMPEP_0177670330 /NCGR_PEP_ID=MMETSP0447-20121125/24019_1 /TAXON_ID=0 /ORGANISM="Stygamoeba regulata, Strain BSH-02190019" /LENGTH=63 /DNA_ID=CAMNT_0019177461 /DNA_START=84 /DNA_END=272 /DNA_ORIENTATION=+